MKRNRSRKKRPPATRQEGAPCLGGLPDSDIDAIQLTASASARHGWPDLVEAVCRMPFLVRAKIGELLLEISDADDEECQRALDASVRRAGRVDRLVAAVAEGGSDRDLAYALVMTEQELSDWRAGRCSGVKGAP